VQMLDFYSVSFSYCRNSD